MLPKSYHQSHVELLEILLKLQKQITANDVDIIAIKASYEQLKQVFHQKIMSLSTKELDSSQIIFWQSAQTEIHRTVRLLATELLFLQSARQTKTTEQRLSKISRSLEQLIIYCQKLIDESPKNPPS
ncbi:MAG: heterocyst frequency control protein PatD [Cyanobacteria bacterium P01_G01_bin.49]